jgi:RHS repeat-associated protein
LEGQLLGEYGPTGAALREYVWLENTPVAMFTPDPALADPSGGAPLVYFIHTDHLDAPRIVVDRNNQVRWRWLSEPFGTTAPETNPGGQGGFTQNLRFPGQYADQESGLFYNYHRYYGTENGRYNQSDLIGLGGGVNTYAYVGGNPVSHFDPNGLQALVGAGGGSLGGAGSVGGIGGSSARSESLSRAIDAFGNPFEGMLSTPRPKGMSPIEERQWDRHCKGSGDPCLALKAAAQQAIADAITKMNNMLQDPKKLFTLAYDVPNRALTGTSTTWVGHRPGLQGMIDNINAMIALGQRMGCDMTTEITAAGSLYIPNAPFNP